MKTPKRATAIRFTPEGKWLLEKLSKELGLTQAGTMEHAVRELARRYNLCAPSENEKDKATPVLDLT